jgi:hypothetical protein
LADGHVGAIMDPRLMPVRSECVRWRIIQSKWIEGNEPSRGPLGKVFRKSSAGPGTLAGLYERVFVILD